MSEVDSPKTKKFLATIVKSKAIDIIRKKKGVVAEEYNEAVLTETQVDILHEYIEKESHESLIKAISSLDDIYRNVFEYKYIHELSDREIADILGVTPKLVNVRIFRARKKLQQILQKKEVSM